MYECIHRCSTVLSGHKRNAHSTPATTRTTTPNGIANVNIFMALLLFNCTEEKKKYTHKIKPTKKKIKQKWRQALESGRDCIELIGWFCAILFVFRCYFLAIFYLFPWLSCQNMSTDFRCIHLVSSHASYLSRAKRAFLHSYFCFCDIVFFFLLLLRSKSTHKDETKAYLSIRADTFQLYECTSQ